MPKIDASIGDTSHATSAVADLLAAYHVAKSAHDVDKTMSFFAEDKLTYSDAVLGWQLPSHEALKALFSQYMPNWADGVSYATRVIGDENSAIVFVTDSPELFGNEIRTISAIDFEDGKITRFVDYWDGRAFGTDAAAALRVPLQEFPATFGEESIGAPTDQGLQQLVGKLSSGLTEALASDVAATLHDDVTFEDLTFRTAVHGKAAVEQYLSRTIAELPYGRGSAIRHVVGSTAAGGGGYEWTNTTHPVTRGITALETDGGLISRFTTVWDGTLLDDERLRATTLAALPV
ncbi:nuclear transport factor 2 family protein [Mycobacterium intracellulare]|uniref:nuclear transport factor 2 family protein n=1 Tax=Mycobacterium intracellulare TaxID=1767 RepID=UPI001CD972E8|nr:nuclear transport factor 2 family protein [Mycobacterium intracellulare]MCA2276754.1 nuclear transport factor 2 family protein [Mycobacterium intracellulare]MCA2328447.1 nuclear transport factor 2 family protein [Mycobacterium intracellulare]